MVKTDFIETAWFPVMLFRYKGDINTSRAARITSSKSSNPTQLDSPIMFQVESVQLVG